MHSWQPGLSQTASTAGARGWIGVGLLLAAAQPRRGSWGEHRDGAVADSRGAEICVLPAGPAASGEPAPCASHAWDATC